MQWDKIWIQSWKKKFDVDKEKKCYSMTVKEIFVYEQLNNQINTFIYLVFQMKKKLIS